MLPVFRWDVTESQENVAIFGQFPDGLVVFHAVGFDEEAKRSRGIHAGLCLQNVVQMALCFAIACRAMVVALYFCVLMTLMPVSRIRRPTRP